MKTKVLEKQFSRGSQSVSLISYEKYDDTSIKIYIKSDTINKQCTAIGYVLEHKQKWNNIYYIPYSEMETKSKLIYNDNVSEKDFEKDYNRIKNMLKKILF